MADDEARLRGEAYMIAKRIQRHLGHGSTVFMPGMIEHDALSLADRVVKLMKPVDAKFDNSTSE